jgi:hypothetical protein
MQRLARMAQRRALDNMTEHFSEVAGGLASRVLQVGAGTGSGILWDPGLVLTAGRGRPAPESTVVMTATGYLLTATRSVADPQLPFAAYELPGETPQVSARFEEARTMAPAEWVLAAWHREGDLAFSPGHYLETRPTTCGEVAVDEILTSLALSNEMAGGGVFDLDGALVAVILPCGEGHAAFSPPSVARLIEAGRSLEGQLLALYGLRTAPLTETLQSHFGRRGGPASWRRHRRPGRARGGLPPGPAATPAAPGAGDAPRSNKTGSSDGRGGPVGPERPPGPARRRRPRRPTGRRARRLPDRLGVPGEPRRRGRAS